MEEEVIKTVEQRIKEDIGILLKSKGFKTSKYNIDSIYENHLYDSKNRNFETLIDTYSKELK